MKTYECGKEAEHHFTARFISDPKELHRTLKKMNLHTFETAVKPKKDKKGKYLSNRQLFTRLIILVKQNRVKLQEVHTYYLRPVSYPLASSDGFLAKTPEFVIVDLVQSNWLVEEKAIGAMSNCAVVIDAMCLIHSFLRSKLPKTFMEFAACILTQVTKMGLRFNVFKVDIVFDAYPVISINALEHARRSGHNIQKVTSPLRRTISSEQQLSKQWKEFLRHDPNKKELSVYLYREVLIGVNFFLIYSLRMELLVMLLYCGGKTVQVPELHGVHAKDDTRLFLNSTHAAEKYSNIFLSIADSGVFVIGLFLAQKLPATIYLE